MRVIVAGSRSFADAAMVAKAIKDSGFQVVEIISGGARGVDRLGEDWATRCGIPFRRFNPDWKSFKRGAGPRRNLEMAKEADALVAIWDGESRGTADMIRTARKYSLQVFLYSSSEKRDQR